MACCRRNVYTLVVLCLFSPIQLYSASVSSDIFMIDAENRQSYPLDTDELDVEQEEDVEEKILKLLGLPDTPRPAYKHLKENAAPQFMMHLYQEIQKQEGLEDFMPTQAPSAEEIGPEYRNLSYNLDQNEKIDGVDIVISFVNQPGKSKIGLEHENDKRYYFELDDVPNSELKDAELRVYKVKSRHDNEHYFITVFRIDPSESPNEKLGLTMLDTLTVNSSYEGWLVFNVSHAMTTWLQENSTNHGLYLEVHSTSGDELLPHRAGIVNRHGEEQRQGFMVAFFRSMEPLSRKIAEIQAMPIKVKSRKKRSPNADEYWEAPEQSRYSRKMCQRKHLYVKFKRLRFDSWIIAPDGYPAFYCEGECSFPLSSHMNATNHAIVQTLVSLIQPRRFPKACCAPKTLSAITVLYFDETQNVVMKRYRNMVVKSCGCH
ncbi:bone morphogenetic protein 7-like [Watersipora subatra]|uniref:bone morphogenetic protein 7-like n=1 Tax=Watersipora subatra TaxID=2589382 RepID=UPI00355C2501